MHDTTERRAPLTIDRATEAAATLADVIDGNHPRSKHPAAVALAEVKLRELLEETGGLYVGTVDPRPRMTPEEYVAEIGARLAAVDVAPVGIAAPCSTEVDLDSWAGR